jgi:hypothetical protein
MLYGKTEQRTDQLLLTNEYPKKQTSLKREAEEAMVEFIVVDNKIGNDSYANWKVAWRKLN